MVICAIFGCSNKSGRNKVSFYRIPTVKNRCTAAITNLMKKRRNEWIKRINRSDWNECKANNARVCSLHFISGEPCSLKDTHNPDWAPSLKLGYNDFRNSKNVLKRYKSKKIVGTEENCFTTVKPTLVTVKNPHIKPKDTTVANFDDGEVNIDKFLSVELKYDDSEDMLSAITDDQKHEDVHAEHEDVYENFTKNPDTNRVNSKDTAEGNESNSDNCVVFVPKTSTLQDASPVINGKLLDVTGHLEKSGLIRNTMYIRSNFLSDSQNTIPVYRPFLDIEECEKVLNAPPIKLQRKKHYLGDYKEDDLTTPELKEIHKIATAQFKTQSRIINNLKKQNVKMISRIKLLNERIKILERRKMSVNENSILTEESGSVFFEDDDGFEYPLSSDDCSEFQDEAEKL